MPITCDVFPRVSSRMSGFFFCGITLDGEVNSSDSSRKENSEVDHMEKSFEILLKLVISIASAAIYSTAESLVVVASIEFSTIPFNPSIFPVLSLSIGILVPPIGPAPNGFSFTLPYVT